MKRIPYFAIGLLILVLVASCAPRAAQETGVVIAPSEGASADGRGYAESDAYSGKENQDAERMMIYSAALTMVVSDTSAAIGGVKQAVQSLGGYVSNSSTWYEGEPDKEQLYAHLTVRVPAESLDQALDQFKALALRVEQENVSGQDVTEEYTDLSAQLTNLEATETELRALLTEIRENRGKAEEILQVHERLTQIRGEIERLKGRMQYLERSSALARIDIELLPEEAPIEIVETTWKPLRTLRSAARALVSGLQTVVDALIYIVLLSPIWAIPIAVILLIRYLLRRARRRGRARKQEDKKEGSSVEQRADK